MMTSNIAQFLKDTDAKIKAEIKKQDNETKDILALSYRVVTDLSPINTGQFVNNNIVTINRETTETKDETTTKDEAMLKANNIIDNLNTKKDFTFIIQNNLDYADRLEAGHSSQAPAGVYGVAEERIKNTIKKARR